MAQQHTPGPWFANGLQIHMKTPGGSFLGIAHVHDREFFDSAHYANAHLIAAAPDLLASLERIAAGDPINSQFAVLAISEARAAIEKSRGEA